MSMERLTDKRMKGEGFVSVPLEEYKFGDFGLSEVGHRIFGDENNVREAAEAALAKEAYHE